MLQDPGSVSSTIVTRPTVGMVARDAGLPVQPAKRGNTKYRVPGRLEVATAR